MAQLNATVNDIQLKTNMIKTGASDTDWASDSKYPSAKAVADKLATAASGYPIGSVIITHKELASGETSAVANPATMLGLPGTWTLIDKEFKYGSTEIGPPISFSPSESGISISGETAIRTDHSLLIKLGVASSNDITISTTQTSVLLVSLNLPRLGVSQLSSISNSGIAFASSTNASAAGAVVYYDIRSDGKVYLNDVINGGTNTLTLKKNTYMYINAIIPINHTHMIDSFCDKFYWKRIA